MLQECHHFARAYVDDVIFSMTEHLDHLYRCLQKAGLTLKRPKCQLGLNYVRYLIGEGEVRPDPGKVDAYQKPETKSDVSAFLGLTGYLFLNMLA